MKIVNTHDQFYLKEERYENPKEIFKIAATRAKQAGYLNPGHTVVDVGCAAGEFLYYLDKHHPGPKYAGYEYLQELVDKAQKMVPAVPFKQASVLNPDMLPKGTIDALFMIGVHSYFDEPKPWLENILNWIKPGGYACIFGVFNPHAVDILMKYRFPGKDTDELRPGWNNWSTVTISSIVEAKIGKGRHEFVPFEMPFDMHPKPDDPIRSWTFPDSQGRRIITNGLCIIQNQMFLEIRR